MNCFQALAAVPGLIIIFNAVSVHISFGHIARFPLYHTLFFAPTFLDHYTMTVSVSVPPRPSSPPTHNTGHANPEIAQFGIERFERFLSANELSYFLPSRADGANDMCFQLQLHIPVSLISTVRFAMAWAIIRLRHPLLASKVDMPRGRYDEARFIYTPPASPTHAIREAQCNFEVHDTPMVEKITDNYLNGPRVLSANRPAYAYLIRYPSTVQDGKMDCALTLCAAHYATDGISVNLYSHELLCLLGGSSNESSMTPRTDAQLASLLEHEWSIRWGDSACSGIHPIPAPTEERIPQSKTRLESVARVIEFNRHQGKAIGGHAFSRKPSVARQCVRSVFEYTPSETRTIVSKCRKQGVTLGDAIFAAFNIAWIRTMHEKEQRKAGLDALQKLPMMIYTAVNLRPYLGTSPVSASHAFTALGYLNIILPTFVPKSEKSSTTPRRDEEVAAFWHRARSTKAQKKKNVMSELLFGRTQAIFQERGRRAKAWAREDDGFVSRLPTPSTSLGPSSTTSLPPAPSAALLGLTLLGSLDAIFVASAYPLIQIKRAVCDTRKNKGGMLAFVWTLGGALTVQLTWDAKAFEHGDVETFWQHVGDVVRDILLGESQREMARL